MGLEEDEAVVEGAADEVKALDGAARIDVETEALIWSDENGMLGNGLCVGAGMSGSMSRGLDRAMIDQCGVERV